MEKEFVPYEQALELEELDFDEPCYLSSLFNEESGGFISTPLYQQSFRWFREKHNIAHSIDWMTRSGGEYPSGYIVHFRGINGNELNEHNLIVLNITEVLGYEVFPTYEEAELACLKKLIEMVKTKQNGKENNA
jgi:hypothetical protein